MTMTQRIPAFLALLILIPFTAMASEAVLKQAELNASQAAQIEELRAEVENPEKGLDTAETTQAASRQDVPTEVPPAEDAPETQPDAEKQKYSIPIDRQSDLGAAFVEPGDFPNSIKLAGPGRASISLGGYIRVLAIWDSDYEFSGNPAFVPAILGMTGPDTEGQMQLDASLSSIYLRTQAPVANGTVGTWLQVNFVNDFTLYQAFFYWAGPWGEVTAGKEASALNDKDAAIVALTEPNVHGAGYKRADVLRYGQTFNKSWHWSVSFEDPDSGDILRLDPTTEPLTEVPNVGARLRWDEESIGHVQLASLYRRFKVRTASGKDSANGWGFHLSSTIYVFGKDWLIPGVSYGEGLGTHLLGLDPFSAGVVMPDGTLEMRRNFGYYLGYRRYWSPTILTTFAYGRAEAEHITGMPPNTFRRSDIYFLNTFFNLNERLTLGIEYEYGIRENIDGSNLDSHRVMVGFQLY